MEPIIEQQTDELTAKWVPVIQAYEREAEKWTKRARKIIKRYKDERADHDKSSKFNVLWSNIETLKPALYAQTPKPEVERRFKDADAAGRVAADVLERCLSYSLNNNAFGSVMRQAVLDYLLTGRGTAWARYVPHMRDVEPESVQDDGVQVTDDAENEPVQEVYYEEVLPDYVHWEDFGHTVARTWEEVTAVWRKVYLTRAQLVERFGEEIGNAVPLDFTPKGLNEEKIDENLKKATIYELWDKDTRTAIWLSKNFGKVLDERDDPLKLDKFFPCPKPIHATLGNDSLIPVPDYVQYQDQAGEMDELTGRIASITKAIKVVGVYDGSAQGLERMLSEGVENQLIPVDQWAAFAEKGGIKGVVDWMPIEQVIKTLLGLYDAREKVKNDLYEITGMSDIIRGQTNANETATAQNIKTKFVTLRLSEKQREIQRFARNVIEIMGQVIAGHFSIGTIRDMSGVKLLTAVEKQQIQQAQQQWQMIQQQAAQQAMQQGQQPPQMPPQLQQILNQDRLDLLKEPTWEEVDALLKDNAARCFRIDIETDSTIEADEQQEKQDRMEMIQAVGGFLEKAAMAPTEMQPLLGELLMFGIRAFRVGKSVESSFQELVDQLREKAKQPPQPPQPDPTEMAKIQATSQAKQAEMRQTAQLEQQRMQAEQQMEQFRQQLEQQRIERQNEIEAQRAAQDAQHQAQLAAMQQMHEQAMAKSQEQMQLLLAHLNNAAKVEVAEIAAQTTLDAAQMSAAKQASSEE